MKQRFSEVQILGFLREAEAGVAVKDLCRRHGFSEASYYLWRSKFGGMTVSDAKRLKALEQENARLKRLVADLSLDNSILKEGQRETSKPGPTPRRGPACPGHDLGVRTPGLPRGGTLSSHATVCTHPNG